MRVELVLEAVDKASRAVRTTERAFGKANAAVVAGAAKATAATEKANRATVAGAKAAEKAAAAQQRASRVSQAVARGYAALRHGARTAGDAARAAARVAEQGWQRALVAVEAYTRKQAGLVRSGIGQVGAGARRMGQGALAGGKVAAGVATGAGVLGGAAALVSSHLLKPAASIEKYSIALTKSEKSVEGAQKALKWIDDFAVKAHTGLDDVAAAFVHLRQAGMQPMDGSFKTIGDASAGAQKSMADTAQAMANALKGNMAGMEDFGISAQKMGRLYKFTFTDAENKQRHLYARTKETAAVQKALLFMLNSKHGGAMEKAAGSWDGKMERMGNQFSRFKNMIMRSGLFDWMNDRLSGALDQLDAMAKSGELDEWAKGTGTALMEAMTIGWEAAKGFGKAILGLARGARSLAVAMGGWENFVYLAMAVAFAGPLFTVASGLLLVGKGAITAALAIGRLAIMGSTSVALIALQSSLQLAGLAMRGAVGGTMLLGRSLIFLTAAAGRAAIAAGVGLARAMIGLPAALAAGGGAAKGLALALVGLPGRLMAAARGLMAMAAAGLRTLPGLLAGAARGVALMAGAGLKALPGLLMAAARGFVMLGASLMATPIGWLIAGIAAIAAGAYLIYANWDSIGPWFAKQWEAVKAAFVDAWAAISGFDWTSLLPSWDWLELIPAISLPTFAWRELLPSWDWSSIIPSLPDFGSWFKGGEAASAPPATPAAAAAPATDPKRLAEQAALAQKVIEALKPAAQAAVAAASAVLAGASFHSHGLALMNTLAAGIRAGAGAAVSAVQGITQQMRDYLPHSPAKVGPLSDLDKVRFSETLASAIRPGPAVSAAMSVAAGMRAAVAAPVAAGLLIAPSPVSAGLALPQSPVSAGLPIGRSAAEASPTSSAPISISAPITVTITGSVTKETERQLGTQLRDHADEIARIVDETIRRRARKEF